MNKKAIFAALLALAPVLGITADARAADPAAAPLTLAMNAAPIFGNDAALGYGWEEIIVTLANSGAAPKKGTLELTATLPWSQGETFITRAPFNVPAGRTAIVRVPTHGFYYQAPTLTLSAKDEKGAEITGTAVTTNMTVSPTLIDIDQTPRLGLVVRGHAVTTTYSTSSSGYGYGYGSPAVSPALSVGAPTFDATTGDPVLPQVAASYSGVTVAIIHSDLLAKLPPEEFDALRDWVSGGGTLAVVPNRPEDLRGANLTSMTGGPLVQGDANPGLFLLPAFPKAGPPAPWPTMGGGGLTPPPPMIPENDPLKFDPIADPSNPYKPIGYFLPASTSTLPAAGAAGSMAPAVKAKLVGFTGGNLTASDYGATASFGTGQVHVLAFDPTVAPGIDDGWVLARVVDMVQTGWDRQAPRAFPTGAGDRRYLYNRSDEVRRALDPNENFRPALGFAAILLVVYSIVVGPITFLRAQKKGTPLAPLKWAPLWSMAAFASIVVVGLAVKGLRGRSRRLSLTELGAGTTRGSVTRFRGFYTSETKALSVAATDRSTVLDVSSDGVMGANAVMRLDRGGSILENITSLPWQTMVVREDGFRDLKGAVAITGVSPALSATNHTGQAIDDALFYVPGDGVRYFAQVKDGETVVASTGKLVMSAFSRRSGSAGAMTIHLLGESEMAYSSAITKKDGERIEKMWKPMSSAAGEQVDWWPDDQPVLMGELEGGEGVKTDSGLRIETDRALVRVVGRGGAP